MSIKTRIGIALGAVLLLHIFTAVMGHVGLERSQRDFVEYDRINTDTITILTIDRQVEQLQRHVSSFMLTGQESIADRVRILREEIEYSISAAQESTDDAEVADRLGSMLWMIRSYGDDFEKVATDRAARNRLIREEMIPSRDRILGLIEAAAIRQPDLQPTVQATIDQFLRGETAAMQYYETPDRNKVDMAIAHLESAARTAAAFDAEQVGADIPAMLNDYQSAFFTSVNATRGYFHLVNVVLAGEAAELLNNSADIRRRSLDRREALGASLRAESNRFQFISDLVAVLTVLCGLAMASLMTRSVVGPIRHMTETFRQLSRGESETTIDGVSRTDEFGEMSKAAEVFRIKNIQTEHLLDESQRMGADLERRNSEMTQFVYTVSHDLKSPLVTILGYTGMLEKKINAGEYNDLDTMIERVTAAGTRMTQTLDDLLELSKIGVVVDSWQEIDVKEVCDVIISDLENEIAVAGAEIAIQPQLASIYGDELRIRQVLQNLIQNALKYGRPDTGVPLIQISCEERGDRVVLEVADNGPGIEPKYAEQIFKIFQRLDATSPGTGVGLAIVKKIAEAHEGSVWMESTPGEGATFIVEFPIKEAAAKVA